MTDQTTAEAEAPQAAAKAKRAVRVPGVVTTTAEAEAPQAVDETADLPNAIDVDAFKLQAPVLTKQGWVVPPDFGQVGKR